MTRSIVLAGMAMALGLVVVACAAAAPAFPAGGSPSGTISQVTQEIQGGEVTVAVTWPGPSAGPLFEVALETHSVDLDAYDLRDLAVLRTAQGEEVRPTEWSAPPGGHHRKGSLLFPAATPTGQPLIGSGAGPVELIVRDIAGVPERTFRWAQ